MKKIIYIFIILQIFISCQNNQSNNNYQIIETKKSNNAVWFDDFIEYRSQYLKLKKNHDLILGIGDILEYQNLARESAIKNGEKAISSILTKDKRALSTNGVILDEVIEIFKNNQSKTLYKYTILMEVNKFALTKKIEDRENKIKLEKLRYELSLTEAKDEIEKGNKYFENSYNSSKFYYEKALQIYKNIDYDKGINFVFNKIKDLDKYHENKNQQKSVRLVELKKEINQILKKNYLSKKDLIILINNYKKLNDLEKVKLYNERLKSLNRDNQILAKKNKIRYYIKSITGKGYLEDNYNQFYLNYKDYFNGDILLKNRIKNEIFNRINKERIIVIISKSLGNYKNYSSLEGFINKKYPNREIMILMDNTGLKKDLIFKYNSYNFYYLSKLNQNYEKTDFGYAGWIGLTGKYVDYFNNKQDIVNYPTKRSEFSDYRTKEELFEALYNSL